MEDFEEQEYEFLRRLDEEQIDRRSMLRRGAAAGAGLTVLALPASALAARKKATATAPLLGRTLKLAEFVSRGEEGRPAQRDRAAAGLGELRRDHQHVLEEVRHPDHERQPGRQLGAGEPGGPLAQGRPARSGRARRQPVVRRSPVPTRASTPSTSRTNFKKVPRAMKDGRGFWVGDYWGVVSFGVNTGSHLERAEVVGRPAQARVQEQGRAQRQPALVRALPSRACSRPRSRTAAR